ncbi:unnamed protein product [Sphacelaria rigidula]
MLSGQMLNEDGVVSSRAVAMRDCMVVPVPPLVSPKKASETGEIVDAQASAEAEYLWYWLGGKDMLFGGMLRFTMGVLEVADRSYRTKGIVSLWCAEGGGSSATTSQERTGSLQRGDHLR